MKKSSIRIICLILIFMLLTGSVYAWFKNNRQVVLKSSNNIQIKSSGLLVVGYSTDAAGNSIGFNEASYSSSIALNLDGRYDNVSGNGLDIYAAKLNTSGVPESDKWTDAAADTAVSDSDTGSYVTAEIYFKSDAPMDIYLMQDSAVQPKTADSGNDLVNLVDTVNSKDYSGYTRFSEFEDGLPKLNINQSSFGLFSRNLIAGAARVSFSEYTYDASSQDKWISPSMPGLVWVPNSSYKLTKQTNSTLIYKADLNGEKESEYKYHISDSDNPYSVTRLPEEMGSALTGVLYYSVGSNSGLVSKKTIVNGDMVVSAREVSGNTYPIPQIYTDTAVSTDAAFCKSLDCLVAAEYDDTYSLTNGFAFKSGSSYVRPLEYGGYVEVEKTTVNNQERWTNTDPEVTYTSDDAIATVEAGFVTDSAVYVVCNWMEDSDFTKTSFDSKTLSKYKIASTVQLGETSGYYARVKICIWVEGYDREADVALNGGEFNVNLSFYGEEQ